MKKAVLPIMAISFFVAWVFTSCEDTLVNQHTVTFFSGEDGIDVPPQYIQGQGYAEDPGHRENASGQTIVGWYTEPSFVYIFDFSKNLIDKNIILYAKWSLTSDTKFTVSFDTGEGTSTVNDQLIPEGGLVSKPNDPIYAGHVFVGWFTDSSLTTQFNFDEDTITSDITLYASWSRISVKYTVSFDTGEGASTIDDQEITEGNMANKPNNPNNQGHIFLGWYTDSSYQYEFDFTVEITKDTNLYAQWKPENAHSVTFDTGQGGPILRTQWVANGASPTEPAPPVKLGYSFLGWYKEAAFVNKVNFGAETITQDITYFAQWSVNAMARYFISFNSHGGSHITTISYLEGEELTLPADPDKTGYTFSGWYKDEALNDIFDINTDAVQSDITLHAKWEMNTYTVTYDTNGGEFSDSSTRKTENVLHGNMANNNEGTPTKSQAVFLGWHTAQTGQSDSSRYSFQEAVVSDITLYAHWSEGDVRTVNFHVDGGSTIDPIKVEDGSTIQAPSIPTKTGYIFLGWYADSGYSNEFDFTTAIDTDTDIYVKWATAPTGLSIKENSASEWYGSILLTGAQSEDEAKLFVSAVNSVFPGFLTYSWGDSTSGFSISANTNPDQGLDHACLIPTNIAPKTFGMDFTIDGELTDVGDDGCTYPNRSGGGGGGGNGGETGIQVPATVELDGIEYPIKRNAEGYAITEVDDVTGKTIFLLDRSNTTFDGLTTVEDSMHASQSGSYFLGYSGVWGQTFASSFYRNQQGAYALSPHFAPLGSQAVFKLHDDDIMKNTVFAGAPAMYSHLAISFLNPEMNYIRGSYDMSVTGLDYTNFPAGGFDSRYKLLNLREQIRVANRRNQKVVLAMGGATFHEWENVAAEGNSGQAGPHIRSLADLLLDLNADGLDVDYERHTKYGHSPVETAEELRGAIRALRMAVDLANQEDDDKKDRILTISAWSTGADVSWNAVKYGGSNRSDGQPLSGPVYTQVDKNAAKSAYDNAVANGEDHATIAELLHIYNNVVVVGSPRISIWGGGAGMHRHAFEDASVKELIDILSVMSYDASYHNFDPVLAWHQYRNIMPNDVPVLLGFEQGPEGWNDGQVLVRKNADAGPTGTIFEEDTYGNELTNAYYSVERLAKYVKMNKVNDHDGVMIWTMTSRDATLLSAVDPDAAEVAATAGDVAAEAAEQLGLPMDIRTDSVWTVYERK